MPTEHLIPDDLRARYHVREWRNAAGVLMTACPDEWQDIIDVLRGFRLLRSEILTAGGGLSPISQQINAAFGARGWREEKFETRIMVGETEYASPTHSVDCFKGRVALELEWNNKDPFFDRDLNNFRLLFDLRAIDVGVILTRATELQAVFDGLGKGTSYGSSTTAPREALAADRGRQRRRLPGADLRDHPGALCRRRRRGAAGRACRQGRGARGAAAAAGGAGAGAARPRVGGRKLSYSAASEPEL